ncbi:hypothetical protein QBC43DRAFT_295892 [Cladorrhinum sp. PSN259]|nr:hypothetical protein QBC43DRAFT_295892 [Cladorrhinum sp. PSN259]
MSTETETIDALLERYLTLLDSYTQLRTSLNALQAGMYQHLARANFSADRGIRYYGQDYYDERMQATRRTCIGDSDDNPSAPVFTVKSVEPQKPYGETEKDELNTEETAEAISNNDEKPKEQSEVEEDSTTATTKPVNEKKKHPKSTDPLRWFGILTPLPLRQAQSNAIKAVEDIIPQLASVSAEMASVELEVRRARKRRAKAEKEEEKKRLAELEKGVGGLEVNADGTKEGVVA